MKLTKKLLTLTSFCLLLSTQVFAVTQVVGDIDGFGIDPLNLVNYAGNPADTDGDGVIEAGEFLPDWNGNGSVAINSADEFDYRSALELSATNGAQNTDYAIIGTGLANGMQFKFTFTAPLPGDADYGVDHFINFVFGDYDVYPAQIKVDGVAYALTLQGSQDGLVQKAYATVPWGAMTDGEVIITIEANREPYLAFDYALLDTDQIADQDGDAIPDSLDNCIDVPNFEQTDSDNDGVGDACDDDADNDSISDDLDNCPNTPNTDQSDVDGDGLGDACDLDNDNDGVDNNDDLCDGTLAGPVNFQGCSVDQLCPCDDDWKNHGEFMSCISHASEDLLLSGIITEEEKDEIVSSNAKTTCGKKRR